MKNYNSIVLHTKQIDKLIDRLVDKQIDKLWTNVCNFVIQ